MTLLELIVVIGVLSVLMGFGVGFLRRSDGLPEARSALVAQLRLAALDARSRALPTEVVLTPGESGAAAEVAARGLDPIAVVTFEPGQRLAFAGLEPVLGGEEVPTGRCGAARAPSADDKSPALRMPLGPDVADLRNGFAIRIDVLLRRRAGGRILRLSRGIDLEIDAEGRPHARLLGRDEAAAEGAVGTAVNLLAQASLPIGTWCTVELGHDGSRAWLALDGRELAHAAFTAALLQQKGDALEVGPADDPLPGAVDELQLFAYAFAPAQRLPEGVVLLAPARIHFDIAGEPVVPPEIRLELRSDGRIETLHIGPGGILQ